MKTKKLLNAVEDGTHTAVEYLSPYVEQALRDGGELADQTYSKLRPVLKDARIFGARLAADTFDKVHPVIDDALDRVSPAVDATVKRVKPAVDDVLQRIPPTVEYARERVQEDFLPGLADLLSDLARQPLARELKLAAATAALSKEIRKVSKPKHSGWKTFGKILLAGAALGAVAVAIRKLLADPSTGWESHVPSTAYVADPVDDAVDDVKNKAADLKDKAADVVEDVKNKAADLKDKAAHLVEDVKDKAAHVVDDVKDKAAGLADDAKDKADDLSDAVDDAKDKATDLVNDAKNKAADVAVDVTNAAKGTTADIEDKLGKLADEAEGGDASPLADSPYGEGSYVGGEPPQGFTIKGNDRSMKYHVPGSAAYERTIAEVWFNSEDAAREAGFVRAQH